MCMCILSFFFFINHCMFCRLKKYLNVILAALGVFTDQSGFYGIVELRVLKICTTVKDEKVGWQTSENEESRKMKAHQFQPAVSCIESKGICVKSVKVYLETELYKRCKLPRLRHIGLNYTYSYHKSKEDRQLYSTAMTFAKGLWRRVQRRCQKS